MTATTKINKLILNDCHYNFRYDDQFSKNILSDDKHILILLKEHTIIIYRKDNIYCIVPSEKIPEGLLREI